MGNITSATIIKRVILLSQKLKGYLFLFLTIFLFSTFEIVGHTLTSIDTAFVNAFRFFVGGLVLLPFALYHMKKEETKLSGKDYLWLFLLGLLNAVFSMNLLQFSLKYSPASTSAILFSTNPIFVALFSSLLLREKPTPNQIIGILLGILGSFFVTGGMRTDNIIGPLLSLGAAALFGLYTVAGKNLTVKLGSLTVNSISFLFGGAVNWLFLFVNNQSVWQINANNYLRLLYLGVFVTGLAYYAFFTGLSVLDTTAGSSVFFAKPVFASILAWIFLDEPITWNKAVGIVIILIAMRFVMSSSKSKQSEEA